MNTLWHYLSLGLEWKLTFSSPVATAEFSKFAGILMAGLVVLKSLNFCLFEKLLISPSILSETFAGSSNLGYRFFPFNTLNISCHSLLACRVSAERSAVKHMGFPLYVLLLFACCF